MKKLLIGIFLGVSALAQGQRSPAQPKQVPAMNIYKKITVPTASLSESDLTVAANLQFVHNYLAANPTATPHLATILAIGDNTLNSAALGVGQVYVSPANNLEGLHVSAAGTGTSQILIHAVDASNNDLFLVYGEGTAFAKTLRTPSLTVVDGSAANRKVFSALGGTGLGSYRSLDNIDVDSALHYVPKSSADTNIGPSSYVTKYDNDTAKNNFIRIGQPIAVIDSLGNLTDLATVNQLRYDSIKVASANPTVGNIYVNSTDNRIHYKSGSTWYRLAVQDSTIASLPLSNGLTAYYKFDEETGNAADATGNYNATSNYGVTFFATGKINTAYSFDGSTSQVQIGNVISTNVFSIGAWVYTSSATIQTILSGQTSGMPDFQINANGTLDLLSRATKDIASSTGAITYGAWNYVSVTFDAGGNYNFYINGANVGSGNNPTTFTNLSSNYIIGTVVGASQFNGTIDELAIFSTVKTASNEISLYNSGTGHAYPLN